ncbi:MAG: cytochrome c biogenesis CcdA family protein [Saccharofermentanales bacterium]
MPKPLEITQSVSIITVFLQGLVTFLSPCVLPLLPMYFGYLAGGTYTVNEDGTIEYPRKRVFVNTLFFVLGIAATFFVLALGATAAGQFFKDQGHRRTIVIVGGVIILLFGLYQLGVFGRSFFVERERRLPIHFDRWAMNPLVALLMGFTFSFAWTPCIGPTLTSVLMMAAGTSQRTQGFLLVGVYAIGFILPFLIVGLFATRMLAFFRRHSKIMKYTVLIGGLLMIVIGILMLVGIYGA